MSSRAWTLEYTGVALFLVTGQLVLCLGSLTNLELFLV